MLDIKQRRLLCSGGRGFSAISETVCKKYRDCRPQETKEMEHIRRETVQTTGTRSTDDAETLGECEGGISFEGESVLGVEGSSHGFGI